MFNDKRKYLEYGALTVVTILGFLYLMSMLLGFEIMDVNNYNTYALQADSWRQGRLDLGQDYPWLELAIYNGKYYCSFPPFPSYLLFPLTFIWGSQTPDFWVMILIDIVATVYLYKLAVKLGCREEAAMLLTVFVTLGANTMFVMVSPWVWFMAQMLCFATAVMAIYYAVCGKGGLALFFWAASVGCRPMQIVFLPILLMLLYQKERTKDTTTASVKLVLRRWYWAVPMGGLALSYMLLNYLRFGSITEFGRKYLPEFMREEKGQFHIDYLKQNLPSLFRLPQFGEDGRMIINHFGDLSLLIVSPIVVMALVGLVYMIICKENGKAAVGALIVVLSAVYLVIIALHRTLGAWQFGNRYAIDILPYIYLFVGIVTARKPGFEKYCMPLCVFGVCLNMVGTVIVYNGL
ncbi:MAG: hypothetical protein IJ379_13750 [Lachnospiraceae bacterium]|nr:hypothetical protein [Lachnospiraceae bacterium]MBQ7776975.1 hypothetical protein [Lachnospiraceae bacterium]